MTKKLDDYKEKDTAMVPSQPEMALTSREQAYAGLLDQQRFSQPPTDVVQNPLHRS